MNARSLVASALAFLIGSGTSGAQDDKSWSVAVAKNKSGGANIIVRVRTVTPEWLHKSSYGALVVVSWPNSNANGMPTKEESKLHYTFEDKIQDAEEREKVGLLAAVATGGGKVEWYFYTKSHDEFMGLLNKTLHGQPRLPINISLEQDPTWSMYKTFSGGR